MSSLGKNRLTGINPVLNFFGEFFQAGYEYRTIWTHRLSVSLYHRLVERLQVGVHPRVSELIKGRTQEPEYTYVWNV